MAARTPRRPLARLPPRPPPRRPPPRARPPLRAVADGAPATTTAAPGGEPSAQERTVDGSGSESDEGEAANATLLSPPPRTAEAEALAALEWPAVCQQFAALTHTLMGARAAAAGLPLAPDAAAAATLAAASREAGAAALDLRGAVDVGPMLADLASGRTATLTGVAGAADTLDAAAAAAAALEGRPALAAVAGRDALAHPSLAAARAALRAALPPGAPDLADDASIDLASARAAFRAADDAVKRAAADWARRLAAAGAAERAAVAVRRDRLCVPVRTPRKGDLPRGSVTLGASASGATSYVEPAPLVDLNNAAAAAAAAVADAEAAVLASLSDVLRGVEAPLRAALAAVAAVDVRAAVARHAAWCGGAWPTVVAPGGGAGGVHAPGLLHPLLAARVLPRLPTAPGAEAEERGGHDADAASAPPPAPPRPVDWTPPPDARVVTITGPNTGGKTVSLKTLGVAALLARAGAALPVAPGTPPPTVPAFAPILADVGDPQSLSESLSTFSGRVRRAQAALAAARAAAAAAPTPSALVLLDELGAGTDPTEGAALGGALLDALAPAAALTVATTHAASLARAPSRANASVQLDPATRRPTHRLVWGAAAASSALDVAAGLGYDPAVLADARALLAARRGGVGVRDPGADAALAAKLTVDADAARADAARAAAEAAAAEAAAAQAEADAAAAAADAAAADAERAAAAVGAGDDVAWALQAHAAGELSLAEAEACVAEVAARAAPLAAAAAASAAAWLPAAGDAVRVRRAGGASGVVVRPPSRPGGEMTVRVGRAVMRVKTGDVERGDAGAAPRKAAPSPARRPASPATPAPRRRAPDAPAIMLPSNTVDVRGLDARGAREAVLDALGDRDDGDALFIVHGVGTGGALRAAVRGALKGAPGVGKVSDAEEGGAGVTLVRVRR